MAKTPKIEWSEGALKLIAEAKANVRSNPDSQYCRVCGTELKRGWCPDCSLAKLNG
jgi:hypothetical protein